MALILVSCLSRRASLFHGCLRHGKGSGESVKNLFRLRGVSTTSNTRTLIVKYNFLPHFGHSQARSMLILNCQDMNSAPQTHLLIDNSSSSTLPISTSFVTSLSGMSTSLRIDGFYLSPNGQIGIHNR